MNDEMIVRDLFVSFLSDITNQDGAALNNTVDRSLAVHHIMTGTSQSGSDFISDVCQGKFRIYSAEVFSSDLRVIGDSAFVIGKFTADCEIYGTERQVRRLCMKPTLRKTAEGWKFTDIRISECIE